MTQVPAASPAWGGDMCPWRNGLALPAHNRRGLGSSPRGHTSAGDEHERHGASFTEGQKSQPDAWGNPRACHRRSRASMQPSSEIWIPDPGKDGTAQSPVFICGSSSMGRARPFQGRGCGFKPRLPLHMRQGEGTGAGKKDGQISAAAPTKFPQDNLFQFLLSHSLL